MKKLVLIYSVLQLAQVQSATLGGVGVGNGMVVAGLNIRNNFADRVQAEDRLRQMAIEINSGKNKTVASFIKQGNCDPTFAQMDEAKLTKYFPVKEDSLKKKKEIVIHTKVFLKNCKKYKAIKDHKPFDIE